MEAVFKYVIKATATSRNPDNPLISFVNLLRNLGIPPSQVRLLQHSEYRPNGEQCGGLNHENACQSDTVVYV